jgi:ADP-ribosylglycohydrolase
MPKPHDHAARMARALLSLDGLSLGERFFGESPEERIAARALPPAPWFWTDDTEMALAVCEVLDAVGGIDRDRLAAAFTLRFVAAPGRGYGGGAHQLLRELALGARWDRAARALFDGQGSFGNGGAMRAGPIGAYFADDLEATIAHARASAEVTHAHPEGQAGAIAVALAALYAWRSKNDASFLADDLLDFVIAHLEPSKTRAGIEAARALPPDASISLAAATLGSGNRVSSVDTVPFALLCARRHLDDLEEACWSTVAGLGDRDTTCAIVGSIVVLRTGPSAIPSAWREAREPIEEEPVMERWNSATR